MQNIKLFFEFFFTSFYLDYLLITGNLLTAKEKFLFILKKYYLIIYHLFFQEFKISRSRVNLFGDFFYYDSKYGLAGLQGIFTRHKRELDFIKDRDIKVIIDVGANVGCFTLLCSRLFQCKSIDSFEPIPDVFKCLNENTKNVKNVRVHNLAVSNNDGESYMSFDEQNSSISKKIVNKKGLRVKNITLESFFKKQKITKIDLLKIDVESFENLVLEGAQDVLQNVRYLMIEITIKDNSNYTISSIFSQLKGKGYDFQLLSFRNAADKSFGEVPWMDCLLENVVFKK